MKTCYIGLMQIMNISPSALIKYLQATLQMMLGKRSPEDAYDISEEGIWQAIFASWIISSFVCSVLNLILNIALAVAGITFVTFEDVDRPVTSDVDGPK